jgi:hypothetical protein
VFLCQINPVVHPPLRTLDSQLHTLSPLATLERGYAIARHPRAGKVMRSVAQVIAGDRLKVQVSDGQFESTLDHLYRNSGGRRPEKSGHKEAPPEGYSDGASHWFPWV